MIYDVSDGELIYLYRCGNYDAFDFLTNRYKKRIYGIIEKSRRANNLGSICFDDYYHECYITFLKCLDRYDGNGIFFSYVMVSLENFVKRLMEKEIKYSAYSSLEDYLLNEDSTVISGMVVKDASYLYLEDEVHDFIEGNFDELSKIIIEHKMQGYNCKEIMKKYDLSRKLVYNKIGKIKNIIKNDTYH